MVDGTYEEPNTGIKFTPYTAEPYNDGELGVTFGMALPADAEKENATEYIGYLVRLFPPPIPV